MITEHRSLRIRRRVAAPARARQQTDEDREKSMRIDPQIHALCDRWGTWFRTRRFYAPPANLRSVLGTLRTRVPGGSNDGPNARLDAELAAFHTAWLALGGDGERASFAFRIHFVERLSPVKLVAAELGIGRQRYHELVAATARSAYARHWQIMEMHAEKVSPPEATK